MDMDEYQEHARALMEESQNVAIMVALRQMGVSAALEGHGVEVSAVVPGGRWERLASGTPDMSIAAGDIIIAAAGRVVGSVDDLVAAVKDARDQGLNGMTVDYRRDDESFQSHLPLDLLPDGALTTGLLAQQAGVVFKTVLPLLRSPLDVTIDAGEVGGPSAGLMFALEIVNQLTDTDLAGGRVIAGTGALSELGEALPVGGVRQKVLTAEAAGAEVFLVPRWQLAEARRAARTAEVVPVDGLADALAFLRAARSAQVSTAAGPDGEAGMIGQWRPTGLAFGVCPGRWFPVR